MVGIPFPAKMKLQGELEVKYSPKSTNFAFSSPTIETILQPVKCRSSLRPFLIQLVGKANEFWSRKNGPVAPREPQRVHRFISEISDSSHVAFDGRSVQPPAAPAVANWISCFRRLFVVVAAPAAVGQRSMSTAVYRRNTILSYDLLLVTTYNSYGSDIT